MLNIAYCILGQANHLFITSIYYIKRYFKTFNQVLFVLT